MAKKKDLSRLVRSLREQIGDTQEQFAARIGVTFTSVNRWENGHTQPSPLALTQIKNLLGEMGKAGADLLRVYFPSEDS